MSFPTNEDYKENEQQDISTQDKTSQLGKDTQNFQSGADEENVKNVKISLPLNLSHIKKLKEKQEIQKKEIGFTKKVKDLFEQRQNETTKTQTKIQNNKFSLITSKGVESDEIGSFILNG